MYRSRFVVIGCRLEGLEGGVSEAIVVHDRVEPRYILGVLDSGVCHYPFDCLLGFLFEAVEFCVAVCFPEFHYLRVLYGRLSR